tara:strand:- start:52 stop:270 length:219 start_codon:yes stop_codon:yes gene_type:complete
MIIKNKKLQLAIILYLVIVGVLIFLNPNFFYNNDGKIKVFGIGKNKTMFPLWFVIFVVAVFCYYISVLLTNI